MVKQLGELKRRLDEIQRINGEAVGPAPKPVSGSISVTQAPGETPPVVRLTPGSTTNIVFTDSTGAPWPVQFAKPGDTRRFQVTIPTPNSPVVMIDSLTKYGSGNITVNLLDNPIPITLTLLTGQKEVDVRYDIRVSKRGPKARQPIIENVSSDLSDPTLQLFLDGVPPADATQVLTSMREVQAWRVDKSMYVRTKFALLSPASLRFGASPDGMRAYRIPDVPVAIVSVDGRMVSVNLGRNK